MERSKSVEVDLDDMEPGVKLYGVEVLHPLTGQKLPVYVASYVLADYGPGALMGVPLHDERDCAFALANCLPLIEVISEEDKLVNSSDEFNGLDAKEAATAIMAKFKGLGSGEWKTEYRLRDWLVSRQRYWGCPIPVRFCENCGPIRETSLPLELPEINDDCMSTLKTGRPLDNISSFKECPSCKGCGGSVTREIDTLDTFIDSSWYFLRYLDPKNPNQPISKEKLMNWMPVDIYVGGMEHAIMHLLYARFVHKVICDVLEIKDTKLREPFKELIVQGLVKGKTYKRKEDGKYLSAEEAEQYGPDNVDVSFEKMSKSKGNGVSPTLLAQTYGVDTLRSAIMFGAPPEHDLNFDTSAVANTGAYLQKIGKLADKVGTNSMSFN